jgi:hypothetical protein
MSLNIILMCQLLLSSNISSQTSSFLIPKCNIFSQFSNFLSNLGLVTLNQAMSHDYHVTYQINYSIYYELTCCN